MNVGWIYKGGQVIELPSLSAVSLLIYRRQLHGADSATVLVPNQREIPVGTLKSIISLSGLDESLFRR
jgi:hypothetical protein